MDVLWYCLTVLRLHDQVGIISGKVRLSGGGAGGVTERKGGFSGLNEKLDIDGQLYETILHSRGIPKYISDWPAMNNPRKSILIRRYQTLIALLQ